MVSGKKQYVYRLMKAKCSAGSSKFEQYLNLTTDHGVIYSDNEHPLMNANDHVPEKNILTFGRCRKKFFCKCEPMTIVPWINGEEDYCIDGAPALTINSRLACYYGGIIEILEEKGEQDEDSDTDDEKEEEKDIKEQLPSEVQEMIDGFCDDVPTDIQSYGEEALYIDSQPFITEYDSSLFEEIAPGEGAEPDINIF